jgi:hypothetical protein
VSAVKFLRGTVLGTGVSAGVGEVVELDEPLARFFVAQGRAEFMSGEALDADPGIITEPTGDPRTKKGARTR